jgi:protein-tyrosine phosphatase
MHRITQVLSIGPFASPERAETLLAAGVTHVLNVSDAESEILAAEAGFREVAWVPMSDCRRLPPAVALRALDTLHGLASVPAAHVYVHCRAGLVRAPTILWLYLTALGVPPRDARDWIEERVPMANPGSSRMVTHQHVLLAQMHGLRHYFPHPRGEVVVPFPIPVQGAGARSA